MIRAGRLGAVLILVFCGQQAAARPLSVVTTFSILGDFVRDIGGGDVSVHDLVGPDGDIHGFEPAPRDVEIVDGADLMVANGLGLEGWIDRLARPPEFRGQLVTASNSVMALMRGGAPDPHAWQDVGIAELYVRNIAAGLTKADPAKARDYAARLQNELTELATLDDWVRSQIATVPPTQRRIITTHDAFGYFGRAYGIEFSGALGMTEDSEPSAAGVARLIRQIRAEKIHAIFIENMTDPRLIQEVASEAGVVIGGTLFADALSKPGAGGDTYERMMRHNVEAMVAAMLR